MAKLITNDDTLRQFLPNVFATVKGEVSLFDKVKVDIDLAENWVIETFTSSKTFNTICGYAEDNPIRIITAKLIASEALRRAIPSLDLVLTPNGFGVVSNQNIAPASKERVDRLIGSLTDYRNKCIGELLPELIGASQWLNSKQCEFFAASLFPNFDKFNSLDAMDYAVDKWQKYLELREKAIDIENSIAEEFISPQLLVTLRKNCISDMLELSQMHVCEAVRYEVLRVLVDKPIRTNKMLSVVNFIRNNPESFPEWHASETAKLFAPPIYTNLKTNKGYWF